MPWEKRTVNAIPADYSIVQRQFKSPIVEGVKSRNLFDKRDITIGQYPSYISGNLVANASYSASNFIEVEPSTTYILSGQNEQFAFYDANKAYISGLTTGTSGFTTPANAKYIRLAINNTKIDSVQLEKGNVVTSYTSAKPKLDVTEIDTPIPTEKIDFLNGKDVKFELSKNLFDKSKVTTGRYIVYTTGALGTNAAYSASDFIPVVPGQTFTKNNGEQFAFYNASKVYVSGNLNARTFTVPADCYFVRFSVPNADLDKFQFEKGAITTGFESYGYRLPEMYIKKKQSVIVVAKSGGDCTTIAEAIKQANASVDNQVTILIMPGTYKESVKLGSQKYISLVGVNKKKCIIMDDTGLRANAPLEISGDVYVANLTFHATFTDESVVINNLGSYAVHVDYAGQGTAEFFNCDLISDCSSAIGAGTFTNQTIIFNNCYIRSNTKANYSSAWCYAVFLHGNTTAGTLNQRYILKNCEISGSQDRVIRLANVGSEFDVTFINNMVWSDTIGKSDSTIYTEGVVNVTSKSYGNNVALLNK